MAALTIQMPAMTISDDERTFFAGFDERVAQLRKARSIRPSRTPATSGDASRCPR